MYIYRLVPDSDEDFATVRLVPAGFYKFWATTITKENSAYYGKPLDPLPVIDWDLPSDADTWRQRVLNSTIDDGFSMGTLRRLPDRYVEAIVGNVLYERGMNWESDQTEFMPIRIGDSFCNTVYNYPGLFFLMIGLTTFIEEESAKNTAEGWARNATLRYMLRHINYVMTDIIATHDVVEKTEAPIVAIVESRKTNEHAKTIYYDASNLRKWIKQDTTGKASEKLMVAGATLYDLLPGPELIERADEILADWAKRTKILP